MFKMTMRSGTGNTREEWTWNFTKIIGGWKHDVILQLNLHNNRIRARQTAVIMLVDKKIHSFVSPPVSLLVQPLFLILLVSNNRRIQIMKEKKRLTYVGRGAITNSNI